MGEVDLTPFMKDIFVTNGQGENRLVMVILLGWGGCTDRYLAKYSRIYENLGCSVARFTADVNLSRSFSSYRLFALALYERILEDFCAPSTSVIFHVFSMNGCSVFSALWDLIDTVPNGTEIKSNVKGIVFDSCPAFVSPWQGANAIMFATFPSVNGNDTIGRQTYRVMLTGILSLHRLMLWIRSSWESDVYEHNSAYYRMLSYNDLPTNQLYLYSLADDICSAESIEKFVESQRTRDFSVNITCCVWTDSAHVQHYRKHPNEYQSHCLDFLSQTLNISSKSG
ncbi:hypothetical protein AB6A40_008643 [Gnathostoma spinigerum]|uniref:Transmembrane protein 53 n=1 Tax=Gnathostoma spinigerum TaxID=75299 RepID=A0ABD6EXF0_9BILA